MHQSVRELIEEKALGAGTDIQFGYGRGSDFNIIKDKAYPYIWLDPLNSTIVINEDNMTISETYSVNLIFYKFDSPDSTQDDYKLLLDQTDVIVHQFIRDLQNDLLNDDDTLTLTSNNVLIGSITKTPFIKQMADCLTGFSLSFSLTVPDNFDYGC